ncbi:hypothetical protein GC087_02480 [Pantoea sp. JZ2]|uniref:hypothetical protein n=1 Tax=Pantoea sp. JZ2 TaxID=2654189 RepID=UPI002B459D30|nr:hypothetical protein [Pantoea sp. JZ2]WRH11569.1 hypothetical protein GC087_02480 [Pantoea sp. JZ2]
MTDIYHALIRHTLADLPTDSLQEYSDNCSTAARAINSALQVIGNMTFEASQSEEYPDEDAKRDLNLIGAVLRNLPRIAQALTQNSDLADLENKRRKEQKS